MFGKSILDEPGEVKKLIGYLPEQPPVGCLLYTSDAADDLIGVDLGGRRIL